MNTTNETKSKTSYKDPKILAEVAIFIALSTVLSIIKIWHMPQGGSITLASMAPLLWLALRRGPKIGIFAGVVYGFVQLLIDPSIAHPMQVLLDYPLAFGCIGLAGFFRNNPLAGATAAVAGRFVMHFISGIIFFAQYAPDGIHPWVYSLVYNSPYLLIELGIVSIVLLALHETRALEMYM
ncbi:MAG: energy-coupled thiamine transporter ThiT [Nitrososphaerota archaeon]|jgi:thiamine transporter|nr:energy-coupled thiamine transporter ThiT [Nitrososphaerota archaeon]